MSPTRRSKPSDGRVSASADPLDCSRPAAALFWFLLGACIAFGAMAAESGGRWTALLRVGSHNPLLSEMERELGPVPTPDPVGHDGQLYYIVARDPLGRSLTPQVISSVFLDRAQYRYRRILLPLLAGGFGMFSAPLTLWGLILGAVIGFGLTTIAVADLAFQQRVQGIAVPIAAANIGALLSAVMLTVDALAFGLALLGIAVALRGHIRSAVAIFAAAALTKETYVLVPIGMAAWFWINGQRGRAQLVGVLPTVPLFLWSVWLLAAFPDSGTGSENFTLPLVGYVQSVNYWLFQETDPMELVFAAVATAALVAALVAVVRGDRLTRCLLAPWLALALCSSVVVWGKPNNAARAFAILWPLAVLGIAAARRGKSLEAGPERALS